MLDKVTEVRKKFEALTAALAEPENMASPKRLAEIGRERGRLEALVDAGARYERLLKQKEEAEQIIREGKDKDLAELARADLDEAKEALPAAEEEFRRLLIPVDERDHRDVIVEIRAGTGGGEASLFAADLYRMYTRYTEKMGWKHHVLESNPTELGGFKEIIFSVEGEGAYRRLKYESGVHRV
ncbi:MAG: PCRF domain-containing protein, partial [Candidatus Latescibacterota bacterium]